MSEITIKDGLEKPLEIHTTWESNGEGEWEFCAFLDHPNANETDDSIRNDCCLHGQVEESLQLMNISKYTQETIKQSVNFILEAYLKKPESDPNERYFGI
jgi:hypothetical protein